MKDWVLQGDRWSVKFDVQDLGGHLDTTFRGWSATTGFSLGFLILSSVLVVVAVR